MTYGNQLGETKGRKYEKDDTFVFSSKMSDWTGLHPQIQAKISKHNAETYRPINTDLKGDGIKRRMYSMVDIGNHLGVDPATVKRRIEMLHIKPDAKGQKKFSHGTVLRVKELLDAESIKELMKFRKYNINDIHEHWGVPIKDLKKAMKIKVYTYMGVKSLLKRLNK